MTTKTSLGIRNNNPGNIRHVDAINWIGELASDSHYCVFSTAHYGLRALAKQLWVYQNVHGCRTVESFVRRWAPPNENETQAYINDVVIHLTNMLGVHFPQTLNPPQTPIDINKRPQIDAMMIAIIWHENGCQPYSSTQINAAIDAAGEWTNET